MATKKKSKLKTNKYRTCLACGWVHFAVTRKYAEEAVDKFNTYFKTLAKKDQKLFYGGTGASIKDYSHCHRCGGSHSNFKDSLGSEIPNGSTINPIIKE